VGKAGEWRKVGADPSTSIRVWTTLMRQKTGSVSTHLGNPDSRSSSKGWVNPMKWGNYRFGSIKIDGKAYEKDVILDEGGPLPTEKKPSREFREQFGHTPVSLKEEIPWKCKRLVIGTGMHGRLPVMDEVVAEAQRRGVEIVICTTPEAIQLLQEKPEDTNAILHVTC